MTEAGKHLWEIDHPYYCNEGNYYAHESVETAYHSWADFVEHEGDSDFDMNLVFRWDWSKADAENELDHDILSIFWMGQRKGLYRYSTIEINEADEPAVKEWLTKRWQHLVLLWEGIAS